MKLLAWRLDVAHVDPSATVVYKSGGNSKFRAGTRVKLSDISAHRDTYLTECPGNALYRLLPSIRTRVAQTGLPKLYSPVVSGAVGGLVRFSARLTSSLPWTITVSDPSGATVATGYGRRARRVLDVGRDVRASRRVHVGDVGGRDRARSRRCAGRLAAGARR